MGRLVHFESNFFLLVKNITEMVRRKQVKNGIDFNRRQLIKIGI